MPNVELIPYSGRHACADIDTAIDKVASLETDIAGKQDALTEAQLAAVNSGVTQEDVAKIETNETALTMEETSRAAADTVLTNALFDFNCFDIFDSDSAERVNKTHNDIQYTWNGKTCTLNGTASGTSFNNIISSASALPPEIVRGEKYIVNINSESSDIKLSVFLYPDVGETTNILYYASGELSIPNNCVGIIIRLQVAKNTALVNKKITATITNAKTNKQIDALGLLTRGALDSGNLNDLSENGVFLLAAGRSYTNAPFAAGWLVSIAYTAAICAQIGYDFETGVMQYRQRTANGWKPWKILTPNGYASNPKYMAFGDSLTWGAIWTAGQGGTGHTVTRTDIQNQMPTRIANAIGSTAFTNNGVSGMAYVVNVSAGTAEMSILDKIKTIDLSSYDLVTIAGGRNDAYNSLGTRNSASADGTVCGAIKELIEYMRTTYAFTQFVIIGCTPSATTNAEVWSKVYPGGWTLGEFDAEVGAICEAYNVPYIDWKSCNYMHHWASYTGVDGNYSHPNNDRAYLEMGNYLGGRVSQFFRG